MRAIALLLAISPTATAPVVTPEKPDPQRATQRDVARYLIEQHQALTTCNARLTVIRQWSEQWTRPTAPQR